MTTRTREELRQLVDRETRKRLKIINKPVVRAKQCKAGTYVGGRCMNTATRGDYCYAHREDT